MKGKKTMDNKYREELYNCKCKKKDNINTNAKCYFLLKKFI